MDLAAFERLRSDEGRALLEQLPPYDAGAVLALTTRLRGEGHDPELIGAALTQNALRHKAVEKFGADASSMFFTPDGLEQATRPQVAADHAARFVAAGTTEVYDLGCGIGSDSMAFAQAGLAVHAVDLDPLTAAVASANIGLPVTVADATALDLPSDVGVWLDPARRTTGVADITGRTKRTFRLDQLQPSWDFVTGLGASGRAVGAKLSPSLPDGAIPDGASAQWTSYRGEVLECAIWFGPAADDHRRSARVVGPTGEVVVHASEHSARSAITDLADVSSWLYEADRAVVRAGLSDSLAATVRGRELDPGHGHVTSEQRIDVPYARRYRVLEAMPFNRKQLRSWLRARDVGNLTLKKRGVELDEVALRRELKLRGAGSALLLLARVRDELCVLVLEPDS